MVCDIEYNIECSVRFTMDKVCMLQSPPWDTHTYPYKLHTHTHIHTHFLLLFWSSSLFIHSACSFLFWDWVLSTLFIYNFHNITQHMYICSTCLWWAHEYCILCPFCPPFIWVVCRILSNLGVGRWEEQPHVLPRCFVTNAHKLTNKCLLASRRSKYIAYEPRLIHLLVTVRIIPSPWRPKQTSMKDCLHERNGLKTHKNNNYHLHECGWVECGFYSCVVVHANGIIQCTTLF
jgi:hypothetical protein